MASTVERADIVAGLGRLGVQAGDFLEVHSSLRSFGHVQGGPDTVIAALIDAVGSEGAVVMPAAPASRPVPLSAAEKARGLTWKVRVLPADDLSTPTMQGAIADRFRSRPDVARASYTAWGARATEFAQGLRPFVDAAGKALLLGVRFNRASCLHVGDGQADPAPEIGRLFVPPPDVLADYPVDTWWIGYDARRPGEEFDNSSILHDAADQRGLLTHTRIGDCHAILFDARPVVDLSVRLRQADPYRLSGIEPGSLIAKGPPGIPG